MILNSDLLVADTIKPPEGGFDESRKMFSGTSPEGENCSQAIFTTADLLNLANTSRSFLRQYTSRHSVCNRTIDKKCCVSGEECCERHNFFAGNKHFLVANQERQRNITSTCGMLD